MHSPLNSFLMLRCILMWLCLCTVAFVQGQGYILISMDENQTNHMKAYGITYQVLEAKQEAYWLLNYEGGSFAFQYHEIFKKECKEEAFLSKSYLRQVSTVYSAKLVLRKLIWKL